MAKHNTRPVDRPRLPAISRFQGPLEIFQEDGGPRRIRGRLLRYGEVAARDGYGVRFDEGAIEPFPAGLRLNVQHERARPVALVPEGGISRDGLDVKLDVALADTAEASSLAQGIDAGLYTGLSMETYFVKYRWEAEAGKQTVVVSDAKLVGVAVVDQPGFRGSVLDLESLGLLHEDLERGDDFEFWDLF